MQIYFALTLSKPSNKGLVFCTQVPHSHIAVLNNSSTPRRKMQHSTRARLLRLSYCTKEEERRFWDRLERCRDVEKPFSYEATLPPQAHAPAFPQPHQGSTVWCTDLVIKEVMLHYTTGLPPSLQWRHL